MITFVTYSSLLILSAICILLQYWNGNSESKRASLSNPQFVKFKRSYFLVYFCALFADWLQGPYVYKLYSYYGFAEEQIAVLYVVGFGSSVVFGTFIGALADKVGRKKMCIVFCILYSICCFTKLSPNFWILCIGRIMGGISTSLLFSTFESWYVYEHLEKHDFPSEWISLTFSAATFGNGILAIIAGILANIFSETLNLGPVSPFMMAVPFLMISCFIISRAWNENYGSSNIKLKKSCMEALRLIFSSEKIMLLGMVQSLFESVMYMFVFLWTPVLEPLKPEIGLVFSCFMLCIMIGSCIYQILHNFKYSPPKLLITSMIMLFVSMLTCVWSSSPSEPLPYLSYFSFLLLEIAVGLYFPVIGYLRSLILPESHRASMMNWFRVPLNTMTCLGLMLLHSSDSSRGNQIIFGVSVVLSGIGIVLTRRLNHVLKSSIDPHSLPLTES